MRFFNPENGFQCGGYAAARTDGCFGKREIGPYSLYIFVKVGNLQ
jgi:hypothetical protein